MSVCECVALQTALCSLFMSFPLDTDIVPLGIVSKEVLFCLRDGGVGGVGGEEKQEVTFLNNHK